MGRGSEDFALELRSFDDGNVGNAKASGTYLDTLFDEDLDA